jgi:hypothetical protein
MPAAPAAQQVPVIGYLAGFARKAGGSLQVRGLRARWEARLIPVAGPWE